MPKMPAYQCGQVLFGEMGLAHVGFEGYTFRCHLLYPLTFDDSS
jgi:hypothetical protein